MNKEKKTSSRIFSWMTNAIKRNDRFSTPISFNFKGDTSFKTGIGGCTSILLLMFVFAYFVLLLIDLINHNNSTINIVTKIDNLIYNKSKYNLSDYNFLLGFLFEGNSKSLVFDPTYFNINISQVTQMKSTVGTGGYTINNVLLSYSNCYAKYSKILGSQLSSNLGLNNSYCTDSSSLYIGGNSLSTEYNYVQITLNKCSGSQSCKSSTIIDAALTDLSLTFAISDYYFDTSDYSSPQKININSDYKYYTVPGLTKNINLKLRRNDVSDTSSPFFYATSNEFSFFSMSEASQDISTLYNESNVVLNIKVILDSKYQTIDRQVYTLGDLFGQVGGMDSILTSIGGILVGVFSTKIYMASLLSTFYQVNKQDSSKVENLKEERKENPSNFTVKVCKLGDNASMLVYIQKSQIAMCRTQKKTKCSTTTTTPKFPDIETCTRPRKLKSCGERSTGSAGRQSCINCFAFHSSTENEGRCPAKLIDTLCSKTDERRWTRNSTSSSSSVLSERSTSLRRYCCILEDDKFEKIKQNLDEYRVRHNCLNDSSSFHRSENRILTPELKEYHLK